MPKRTTLKHYQRYWCTTQQENKLILDDVVSEVKAGRKSVIITERKDHIDTLNQLPQADIRNNKPSMVTIQRHCEIPKWKMLREAHFQVLINYRPIFW